MGSVCLHTEPNLYPPPPSLKHDQVAMHEILILPWLLHLSATLIIIAFSL
jgi:hypothetical protein